MNEDINKAAGHVYGKDQVVQIINSVVSKIETSGETSYEGIFNELKKLQKIIEEARAEIGATRPLDINDKHIPTATDELDAVVESTAEATGKIMDSCEVIEDKAGALGDDGQVIAGEVTKIYEACSFQDITGQRITKVVSTLKTIEQKVEKLVGVLSTGISGLGGSESSEDVSEEQSGDDGLMNGPQMPAQAITQDDIDALLAEFD